MINIDDVSPSEINLSSLVINENAGANAEVGTLSYTTVEAGDTPVYTLVSGTGDTHNNQFNISGNSLRATNSLDYEIGAVKNVRVRIHDGTSFYEESFTISVVDEEDIAPSDIELSQSVIAENSGANASVGTLSYTVTETVDFPTFSLVAGDGDADNVLFNINGTNLRATKRALKKTSPLTSLQRA